ncbi:MAG: IS1595 family transposase [Candidatus Nitrosotenuis sp.]
MARGRVRCHKCRADYNPFSNTWLATVSIPYNKWLSLIKLFDLGISARRAAKEAGVSYPAALKAFDTIRYSILHQLARSDAALRGEIEADEAYFGGKRKGNRGRGARNKTIVFGILERGGRVSVSIIQNVSADTLMGETVKKVRRGSIVYTDKWRGYDSLMFCGYKHLSIDHKYKFKSGKVYINGIEGFWSFAKERLIKHHGISPRKFLLYIKEMEWRYNHRHEEDNIFTLLVEYALGA